MQLTLQGAADAATQVLRFGLESRFDDYVNIFMNKQSFLVFKTIES